MIFFYASVDLKKFVLKSYSQMKLEIVVFTKKRKKNNLLSGSRRNEDQLLHPACGQLLICVHRSFGLVDANKSNVFFSEENGNLVSQYRG